MLKKLFFLVLVVVALGVQIADAGEKVYFYDTDPAGTPLVMTDSSGNVAWKADYKPFGEESSVTGSAANDRRFIGKVKDQETGLLNVGVRYQDPARGRFIAPDPVRAVNEKTNQTNEKMLLNPQRLNTYAYGLNNPYKYTDPTGQTSDLVAETPVTIPRFAGGSIGNVAGEGGFARAPMRGPSGSASTIEDLSGAARRAVESVGSGRGPAYGTRAHSAFESEVKALGRDNLTVEQSYLKGEPVRRGTPGSVRADVVEGPIQSPTAIYDLKTGSATLTPSRIQQLQQHILGGPSNVPILEIRP